MRIYSLIDAHHYFLANDDACILVQGTRSIVASGYSDAQKFFNEPTLD